jgi:hypothetical protein
VYRKKFYTTISRWRRIPCENNLTDLPHTEKAGSVLNPIIVGLLILLGCLIMINTSSVVDTARDVYNAWRIADGTRFPLEGPYVGGVFHGGPVWFYLLAVPLWLTPSWIVMSLWVGLLTGMKYALSYACGVRLLDRSFGLIWACLLALPDWTSVNYLIFSHTNLVETSLLLCFYSLIRWQQGSARWFPVMCLAVGLGIHAHPTVYAAGLVAVPFVFRSLWRKELVWWMLPVGALAAILPFAPYLISQSLHQWPDLQSGQGYFESQPLWINLLGFWDVMQGALLDGPVIALRHVLGLEGVSLYLAGLTLGVILLGGLGCGLSAMVRGSADRVAVWFLLGTLLCIAAVAAIRNVTPFYQTFVIYPPFYGLVAWGWWRCHAIAGFSVTRLLIPVSLVSLCGFYWATFQMGGEGHLYIPQRSLMDVRAHKTDEFADAIYYPGWGRFQLGSFICESSQPVFFHGFAGLILEQSYALEAKMRCATDEVYMGGQGEGRHYLGISHKSARHLGIRSEVSLGSMGLYETTGIVSPSVAMSIPEGDVYPPRPYYQTGESELELEFDMAAGGMLAITNLYHFWMPYTFDVKMDGRPVEPLFRSMVNAYYGCTDCNDGVNQKWSVTIKAPKPELVEVVTFMPDRQAP